MIKSLVIFFLVFNCFAKQEKLVFSLNKSVEYNDFKTNSSFTLLDNGKFSFKSSSGGFHLCSGSPSGVFNGQLSKKDLSELLSYFKEMDKSCKLLKSCTTKKTENMFDWSLLGWGDHSDKQYFFKSDSKRPRLFTKIFSLEKSFYQSPEFSVNIKNLSQTKNGIEMDVIYKGEGEYEFNENLVNFVLFSNSKQKRLPASGQKIHSLKSGESVRIKFTNNNFKMNRGDYLIYSPVFKSEISACASLD